MVSTMEGSEVLRFFEELCVVSVFLDDLLFRISKDQLIERYQNIFKTFDIASKF